MTSFERLRRGGKGAGAEVIVPGDPEAEPAAWSPGLRPDRRSPWTPVQGRAALGRRDRRDRPLDQRGGEVRRPLRVGRPRELRRHAPRPAERARQGGDLQPRNGRDVRGRRIDGRRGDRERGHPVRREGGPADRDAGPSSGTRQRACGVGRREDARRLRRPGGTVRFRDGLGPGEEGTPPRPPRPRRRDPRRRPRPGRQDARDRQLRLGGEALGPSPRAARSGR